MGKRKTMEESQAEAAECHRKAKEIRLKAAYQEVMVILKKYPSASETCLEHLKSQGFDANGAGETGPVSRQAQSVQDRAKKRLEASGVHHLSTPAEARSLPVEDLVPAKVDKIEDLTMATLQKKILQAIEPATMSQANLRSMAIKGKVESAKTESECLLEFATGKNKRFEMVGNHRVWELLTIDLKLDSKWRGARCNNITLPVHWPDNGVYATECEEVTRAVFVIVRKTGVKKQIPPSRIPKDAILIHIHIAHNYSEMHALVFFESGSCGPSFNCSELFPSAEDHILDTYKAEWKASLTAKTNGVKAIEDLKQRSPQNKLPEKTKDVKAIEDQKQAPASSPGAAASSGQLMDAPAAAADGLGEAPAEPTGGEREEEKVESKDEEVVDEAGLTPPAPQGA